MKKFTILFGVFFLLTIHAYADLTVINNCDSSQAVSVVGVGGGCPPYSDGQVIKAGEKATFLHTAENCFYDVANNDPRYPCTHVSNDETVSLEIIRAPFNSKTCGCNKSKK